MIARLRVLLPFEFSIPEGSTLEPQEFELASYHVRILPPCRAAIEHASIPMVGGSLREIAHSIVPASQQASGHVKVDGTPAVQANLFQIDFVKSEFDRRRSTLQGVAWALGLGDPPVTFAFSVLNNWLNRYRHLTRSANVRAVRIEDIFWNLEYLTDDERPVEEDPDDLFRFRTAGRRRVNVDVLDRRVWDRIATIPFESNPQAWEILLLDAPALLPEIGPAVVLAYAALEGFIDACLDKLAPLARIPPDLWKWINTRDGFWLRPRTDEQFDVLLKSLTGESLKTQTDLWELFKNIRSARHSYVHTGRAAIGSTDLTLETATELVNGATRIIAWAENLLPKELRREELDLKFEIKITGIFRL